MNFLKLGLASVLVASGLLAGTFKVDEDHSNVGFKVKHMLITNVTGKFDKFHGSFELDEKTNTLKSLTGEVEVASINTENEKRDGHLRSDDFFAAKEHPKMTFFVTKVDGDEVTGKLTIRGTTKTVKFDLEQSGVITDPWGNTRTGLTLETKINRFDYGLKWNKALEAGGLIVGDTVKIIVELEGILAK